MHINGRIQFPIDLEAPKMKMKKKKPTAKTKGVTKSSYRVVVYKVINLLCKLQFVQMKPNDLFRSAKFIMPA